MARRLVATMRRERPDVTPAPIVAASAGAIRPALAGVCRRASAWHRVGSLRVDCAWAGHPTLVLIPPRTVSPQEGNICFAQAKELPLILSSSPWRIAVGQRHASAPA